MRAPTFCALAALLLLSSCLPAMAWGPGAHAVIALEVADERGITPSNEYLLLQGVYGAAAPDFAWLAEEPLASALGTATHNDPAYREPWDRAARWSAVQRSFAWGWLTHNEVWGADHYAHISNPLGGAWSPLPAGYVAGRAAALSAITGIPADICHYYVEVAVDLLLDQDFPSLGLGDLLMRAAASRDWQVPSLLSRSYADVPGSGWLKVRALEAAHRAYLATYGAGIDLPTGSDDAAFAVGMATLYGLTVQESAGCLAAAKLVCRGVSSDYQDALAATVTLVAGGPWP